MFSYQHRYHAGGWADVHKHICLVAILESLCKKETPFGVLDSHAGEGVYPLNSIESQKTKEYQFGIGSLLSSTKPSTPLMQTYLNLVRAFNPNETLSKYPGSSAIMASYLRAQDTALLVEKHPQAITALRHHFTPKPSNIHIHERDSWEALAALVPFKEKRGLVFIDPSYEVKSDYQQAAQWIEKAYKRFSHAHYALWYPILENRAHQQMIESLKKRDFGQTWQSEWFPKNASQRMLGSGVFFINPPFNCQQQISESLQRFTGEL